MSLAIVDAHQWQNVCDLRSGKKVQDDSPKTQMVRGVLERHPYPGDVDHLSNRWVTDTALDLADRYDPGFVCLFYAHQYFAMRHVQSTETERRTMMADVFQEVERFVTASGFVPVVVGTGDTTELAGEINLSRLEGLAISSHWSARYAGLHQPSQRDLACVKAQPQVERVVSRAEWIALFPGVEHDPARIPEYLALAREGWIFSTTGTPLRKVFRIPGASRAIPLATPLGKVESITGVRGLIDAQLDRTRIAFIILEGVGLKDFTIPYVPCGNSVDWFYYEPGDGQFLTLTTGTHQVFAYPVGYRYADETDANPDYPYSGYIKQIPEHTVGRDFGGRSIAVGNHSMLTHMIFGTDIAIECFARNLYNQGCLGVIHR
jgi:hypothetical protein